MNFLKILNLKKEGRMEGKMQARKGGRDERKMNNEDKGVYDLLSWMWQVNRRGDT